MAPINDYFPQGKEDYIDLGRQGYVDLRPPEKKKSFLGRTKEKFNEINQDRLQNKVKVIIQREKKRNIQRKLTRYELKQIRASDNARKKIRKKNFRTASPLGSSLTNAFGSPITQLHRAGYTGKEIKQAQLRLKQQERTRVKRQRFADRGFSSVIGWGW